MGNRIRKIAQGLLLSAVSVVAALFLAEITLRLLRLAPTSSVSTVSAREFESIPGMFTPNQHVLDLDKPDLPYTVSTDSLGFRGQDFARHKPDGQYRVAMIGDSFVFGDFVNDDQTLPVQLQQRLRTECRDPLVINAGLGGTTIVDEAPMLLRTLSLEPDLVILVYTESDIEDLGVKRTAWDALADNRERKSHFPLSAFYPLLRNTALWNLGLRVLATRAKEGDVALRHKAATRDSVGLIRDLRERYGAALTAVRDTLAARNIPFWFVMFPSWRDLQKPSDDLIWLEGFASTHAINSADLLPALRASNLTAESLYLIPKDGHPSSRGHAVAAEALAKTLFLGEKPLPSCQR